MLLLFVCLFVGKIAFAPNDPKMDSNITRSKLSHCVPLLHESQISLQFTPPWSICKIFPIFFQSFSIFFNFKLQNPPPPQKATFMWTVKRNNCKMLGCKKNNPKCTWWWWRRSSILKIAFLHKWQVHWLTPKWLWMLQGQRYLKYVELLPASPKFHSLFALR